MLVCADADERLERLVAHVAVAIVEQLLRDLDEPCRRAGEHRAQHGDADLGAIVRDALGDERGGKLVVDREARDELHRRGADLGSGIPFGQGDEQIELAMAGQHDGEVAAHACIGLRTGAELGDVGRAQRERPDRPHALLGPTTVEQRAQLGIAQLPHVFEALDRGHCYQSSEMLAPLPKRVTS